jgi:predicted RNase H-like HicB family nuclease
MQRILASSGIMWEGDDKRFIALIHDSSEEGESGFCATCAEIPKAVGQGETVEDCLKDLRACIQFILVSA